MDDRGLTESQLLTALTLRALGRSSREISGVINVPKSTIHENLKRIDRDYKKSLEVNGND